MHTDLRGFLRKLEAVGELARCNAQAHWDLEAPAVSVMNELRGNKALWLTEVKNGNGSLVSGLFSGGALVGPYARSNPWARVSISMGLDPETSYAELMQRILERGRAGVAPVKVSAGAASEIVQVDGGIDLRDFPWPRLSEKDGGRYINAAVTVSKDPEGGWTNWGIYRWMIRSRDELVAGWIGRKDIAAIYEMYRKIKRPMPVAIVVGPPPGAFLAGAATLPAGVSEAMLASSLGEEPIPLMKAQTNDLLVPADAEMIIEAEVGISEETSEGPFTGGPVFRGAARGPVARVKCITHRKQPVIPFVSPSATVGGVNDFLRVISLMESARLVEQLRTAYSGIRWIYLVAEAGLGLCVVSVKVPYAGWVGRLARSLFLNSRWFDKLLFVDDDVEAVDLERCLNDMVQKAHPYKDWTRLDIGLPRAWSSLYAGGETAGRLIIDATWPLGVKKTDLPVRTTFRDVFPEALQQKVIEGWQSHYGLPGKPIR